MDNQTTIEIQRNDDICISVEEESIDNSQQADSVVEILKENTSEMYVLKLLDEIPSPLSIALMKGDFGSDGGGACDEQHPDGSQFTDKLLQIPVVKYEETELNEENDVMTEPYLEKNLLSIEALKATHYMPMLSPVDLDEDLYGKYVSLFSCPYSVKSRSGDSSSNWFAGPLTNISKVIAQDLNYEDVVLGNSVTKFPLSSLLEFSPRVFDPGTLLKHKVYESQMNEFDGQLHYSTWIELNEGYVVDGVVVLSVLDLQATLGPLGDLTMNGSDNGLTKAWHDEATLAIKNAPRNAILDEAYKEFGEMTQAIRATLLDDEVTNHYAKYADFNKLILFDPGGNRKFVMICSREVARQLFGKAQEVFVFGFKAKQNIGSEKLGTFEPSMADFQDVAMEMVFREMMVLMIGQGISSLLYEMFQSLQEAQLDDQGNHKTVGQYVRVCLCSILARFHDTDEMQSAGDKHSLDFNFLFWCNHVGMSEYDVTMMKIVVSVLAGFVWDLCQDVILFYIIEDNDVVKRKGIGIPLVCALKQNDVKLNMVAMQIAQILQLVEYGGYPYDYDQGAELWMMSNIKADYYMLKTSMVLVYLKGFMWDPGTYLIVNCVHGKAEFPAAFGKLFDTTSFVTKAVRRGVSSLVLRDFLVIVPCVQWYYCQVPVMSCSPHNIQIIETILESDEMVILKGVELTLQNKQGWSVWWKAIFLDIALILCVYEAFCQIKIWNSLPKSQISMSKERNMLQALIENPLITNDAMTEIFGVGLVPVSYDSYNMWQYHIQNCRDKLQLLPLCYHLVSFLAFQNLCCVPCCSNMLWLVVVLAFTNAVKGAAISKMLYGIQVFAFRPP